jgi:hypothetical protein
MSRIVGNWPALQLQARINSRGFHRPMKRDVYYMPIALLIHKVGEIGKPGKMDVYSAEHQGGTMPDFATVSLEEAQVNTTSGRQRKFINEYTRYIRLLSQGQAGKLSPLENENPATIRRRLDSVAKATGAKLIIRRSGEDVYFWSESTTEEQPKRSYSRRSRSGSPGGLLPPDQRFSEPEELNQGEIAESPALGQTEQVVSDAMRRVDPE